MSTTAPKAPLRVSVGELSCCHAKHGGMTEGAASPSTGSVEGEARVLPHQCFSDDNCRLLICANSYHLIVGDGTEAVPYIYH